MFTPYDIIWPLILRHILGASFLLVWRIGVVEIVFNVGLASLRRCISEFVWVASPPCLPRQGVWLGRCQRHALKRHKVDVAGSSLETGRIRFREVRFQTPNSVSFFGLTEFRGASSVSSFQPIICVPKRTHRVFRRTHRVCPKTQWVLSSETVLSKQYSTRFLVLET